MHVVYDLETTGLSSTVCDVIQFAYARFDDDMQLIDSDSLYFYYEGMHWDQEVADRSHQLSLDFLRRYKDDFRKNLIKAWTVLSGSTLVGFNNRGFDDKFIHNWFCRMGLPAIQIGRSYDCMADLTSLYHKARIKLTLACDMLGFTPEIILNKAKVMFPNEAATLTAHNAAYDVTATSLLATLGKKYHLILSPISKPTAPVTEAELTNTESSNVIDFQKYHVMHIPLYDGSEFIGYITTSSNTKDVPSVLQPKLPDIANLVRYHFLKQPDGSYTGNIAGAKFTLVQESTTVHLVGRFNHIPLDSNEMNVIVWAQK